MRIRKPNKKLKLIVGFAVLLTACVTIGKEVDPKKVSLIKKGMTTQEEIQEMFGEPVSVSFSTYGGNMWTYGHATSESTVNSVVRAIPILGTSLIAPKAEKASSSLRVMFDEKGIVRDYSHKSTKF